MPTPYEWILFDADHTLFDFDRTAHASLAHCLSKHTIELTDELFAIYMRINRACWRAYELGEITREELVRRRFSEFLAELAMDEHDPLEFNREYLSLLPQHPYLFDGAQEMIDHLNGHFRLGIITNGLPEVQRPRIRQMGLEGYFDVIVVSGEIGLVKPDYAYFEHTHIQMGCPDIDRVLVVGDTLHADIQGGKGFGFQTCWYNPGGVVNDTKVLPDYEVQSYVELREMLDTHP